MHLKQHGGQQSQPIQSLRTKLEQSKIDPPSAMQLFFTSVQLGGGHVDGSQGSVKVEQLLSKQKVQFCTQAPVSSGEHGAQKNVKTWPGKRICWSMAPLAQTEGPIKR
jgi:hypothetical protein